jgi:putative aldouronate transport system substrate-binding protein
VKKRIPSLLIALLCVSIVAGCSGNQAAPSQTAATASEANAGAAQSSASPEAGSEAKTETETDTETETKAEAKTETEAAAGREEYNGTTNLLIADEPTELTFFYAFGANGAPTSDMPIQQKAAEITNVLMENIANPSISDSSQSLNTMLASDRLPDLIFSFIFDLRPLSAQGAFVPLDGLIEEYAPNIKRYLSEYPEARAAGTGPDGSFYYLAGTQGGESGQVLPAMGAFIRKDWLDALGLEIPTTFAEFKSVMYAFRNNDPNGNGEKDEIPFFYRDTGIHTLMHYMGIHANWTDFFYVDGSNQVQWDGNTEGYKNALIEYAQWYKDGIIDPEIYTRGSQARQELLGNNTGGYTYDWFASTAALNNNEDILALVPDLNLVPFLCPSDVNGNLLIQSVRPAVLTQAWGITKDCEDPVKAIRFMDFWFSDAGKLLHSYGIEGTDYTMVGGKPVITDMALNHPSTYPTYIRAQGSYEFASQGNLEFELAMMNDVARAGFEMYLNSGRLMPPFPTLSYTEEEDEIITRIHADLTPYLSEFQQSSILGTIDVASEWDNYLAQLEAIGVGEVIRITNDAYQRYYESMAN